MIRQGTTTHRRPARTATLGALGVLITVLGSPAAANEAEVFKWVDADGIVHYSDVPVDERAQVTGIRSERTDRRAVREQQLRDWEQTQQQEQQEEEQAAEDRVAAERQAEDRQIQSDRCAAARERAQRYAEAHRLFEPLPNGDRRYLTDEEITAAREAAELEVSQWCR